MNSAFFQKLTATAAALCVTLALTIVAIGPVDAHNLPVMPSIVA